MAKIAIDAGHGLYTAGKRCLKSLDKNETREWVLNDRVSDALQKYLESAGHTILRVDDTDGSTDVALSTRVQRANTWHADAFVSVHHNAGINGGSGGGLVVYIATNASNTSKKMQESIYKRGIETSGLKGDRYDPTLSANFVVIRDTTMPAVLVECGFMDSKTDIKYILDPKWSEKMALGIAKGVCDIWGGTVKESSPSFTDGTDTDEPVDVLYRVQLGAYKQKSNALEMVAKAKKAGFDAIIKVE